jgi:hypothetical protein
MKTWTYSLQYMTKNTDNYVLLMTTTFVYINSFNYNFIRYNALSLTKRESWSVGIYKQAIGNLRIFNTKQKHMRRNDPSLWDAHFNSLLLCSTARKLDFLNITWLVGWLVYSYCSHLGHRASVKRFVSFQFLNLRHSIGVLGRVISPSHGRYLTQTQNKHKQTSMPRVGFEPTIPAFGRAKTVHASDRAATVVGKYYIQE